MDNIEYPIYVKVRPGAKEFLKEMAEVYELMIFTASISEVSIFRLILKVR
jgi:TFIIF-interacting CTD phosphatase-like protein